MLQINNLIGKIALLLLTFVVGVTSTLLFRLEKLPPTAVDGLPPKVTLCQLAQNPEIYDGLTVRVEAVADDFDGEPFIFDETCGSPRTSFGVRTMNGYWLADDRLRNLLAQADSSNSQVRLLLTGKFDATAKFTCFTWKFGIIMMNFELQPTKRTN